ncbi:hypothetical protein [Burkholderia ubonensis]|uniref:hypothetical protein n=1 Tax=Burkholderia ubonensis TaxID=101571 RepID=UPI000758588C|nr:hypothetical protein [Burkholderia ubonensis]KVO11745.1 hypothetical protein WJ73_19550 [Burkholderia ubonensis]
MKKGQPYRPYTPEEDKIIERAYRAGKGPKRISRMLVDRTQWGIQHRAAKLGLTDKGLAQRGANPGWIPEAVETLLEDGRMLTILQIAQEIGANKSSLYPVIEDGLGTKWHVGGWTLRGKRWAKRFSAGPGPDVPNIERKSVRECARIRQNRARRRAKFNPFELLIHQVSA